MLKGCYSQECTHVRQQSDFLLWLRWNRRWFVLRRDADHTLKRERGGQFDQLKADMGASLMERGNTN